MRRLLRGHRLTRFLAVSLLAGLVVGVPHTAGAAELTLTIQGGRVTLIARDVPLGRILDEWSRIGQTQVVNADQVSSVPLTLELRDVPEQQALAILLRTVSGYLAAPREVMVADASRYDRILILATSQAPPDVAPAPMIPTPAFEPPEPDPGGMPPGFIGGNPYQGQVPDQSTEVPDAAVDPSVSTSGGFDYANPAGMRRFQPAALPPTRSFGRSPSSTPTSEQSAPLPGMIIEPPAPEQPVFRNPYGLPDNVVPGSQPAPPQEPDRSKYANPQ